MSFKNQVIHFCKFEVKLTKPASELKLYSAFFRLFRYHPPTPKQQSNTERLWQEHSVDIHGRLCVSTWCPGTVAPANDLWRRRLDRAAVGVSAIPF